MQLELLLNLQEDNSKSILFINFETGITINGYLKGGIKWLFLMKIQE